MIYLLFFFLSWSFDPSTLLDRDGFFSFLYNYWDASQQFIQDQRSAVEKMTKEHLGDFRLFLMGWYPEEGEQITYGRGEVSDLIRITAINGILNQRSDWLRFIKMISTSHGHVNVHSTYWPSEGWTKDIFKCLVVHSGTISETSISLANLWKKMIEEMGGIEAPGRIIHYAHSIGAAETFLARSLLTHEERQKISVITFGTPYIYPDDDFYEVTHYISYRDGISMLDAVNYLGAIHTGKEHVVFISDHLEGPPLIDHFIYHGSYRDKIEELGAEFVAQYGSL